VIILDIHYLLTVSVGLTVVGILEIICCILVLWGITLNSSLTWLTYIVKHRQQFSEIFSFSEVRGEKIQLNPEGT